MSHGSWRLRHGNGHARRGRWSASFDLYGLVLPYVRVYGEGTDYAYVSVGVGSPGSDPVLNLTVDLEGTRAGRAVCELAWRARRARLWWRDLDVPQAALR